MSTRWIRRLFVVMSLGLVVGVVAGPAGASQGGNIVAQAKKHLLVLSDLPKGWIAQGSVTNSTGSGGFPGDKQLAQCLGVSQSVINLNEPQASSPSFANKAQTEFVQDSYGIFPSASVAQQEYDSFANAKVPSCLSTLMAPGGALRAEIANSFQKGAQLGKVTVTTLRGNALAPHTAGFHMAFPVSAQGTTIHTAFDLVTLVRGKVGSQVFFSTVGATFPASLEKHLVTVAYART